MFCSCGSVLENDFCIIQGQVRLRLFLGRALWQGWARGPSAAASTGQGAERRGQHRLGGRRCDQIINLGVLSIPPSAKLGTTPKILLTQSKMRKSWTIPAMQLKGYIRQSKEIHVGLPFISSANPSTVKIQKVLFSPQALQSLQSLQSSPPTCSHPSIIK